MLSTNSSHIFFFKFFDMFRSALYFIFCGSCTIYESYVLNYLLEFSNVIDLLFTGIKDGLVFKFFCNTIKIYLRKIKSEMEFKIILCPKIYVKVFS